MPLYCDKCERFRPHTAEGATAAKCDECGKVRDASFEFGEVTNIQLWRCRYHRWRWRRGELTEYPPTPGVWG